MRILLFLLLLIPILNFSQQQVTHKALVGAWCYFYITQDHFSDNKVIVTKQRLLIRDGQNATLTISARDEEYVQETVYELKYSLSLRDNVPYISLFSTESDSVLGAYVRMPLIQALEMAGDPNFTIQKQLYKRVTPVIPNQDNEMPKAGFPIPSQ